MDPRRLCLTILVLALLAILVAPAAFTQPRTARGLASAVGIAVSPEQNLFELKQLALTDAEMAEAKPLDLIALNGKPPDRRVLAQPRGGPAADIPGAAAHPEAVAEEMWSLVSGDADMAAEPATSYYGYVPPYTAFAVNNNWYTWKFPPWKTMGKVFFTKRTDGERYYCTAAMGSTRVAWTAGHCVAAEGGVSTWHKDMQFYPATTFKGGKLRTPYGKWWIRRKVTPDDWFEDGNLAYDIAMFSLYDKYDLPLSYYIGYLGFSYNQVTIQHFNAFGYPNNRDSGQVLWTCQASTSDTDSSWGAPYPIGIGCIMGKGSSGGPRLRRYYPYESGDQNFVNGVNSYYYTERPQEVYSAYFGAAARTLYEWGIVQ